MITNKELLRLNGIKTGKKESTSRQKTKNDPKYGSRLMLDENYWVGMLVFQHSRWQSVEKSKKSENTILLFLAC